MFAADSVVKKETRFIAVWEVIFSVALQAVFLVIGKWDYTVLLGNLLSGIAAVVNFWLMGLTVVKTLEKQKDDEKEARQFAKMSQTLRYTMLAIVGIIGLSLPCFNIVSVLVPLLFPRISAWIRMMFVKDAGTTEGESSGDTSDAERGENV
ncbi:MAG: ATP synthase subunit I [Ruminococcus sp.]|nr:ATP synthase subunit I [Ruminococcus sp.]